MTESLLLIEQDASVRSVTRGTSGQSINKIQAMSLKPLAQMAFFSFPEIGLSRKRDARLKSQTGVGKHPIHATTGLRWAVPGYRVRNR